MNKFDFKFAPGAKVRDKVTGFEGIVAARTDWMNGCIKYAVQSRELKDGKPLSLQWFDEQDLEVGTGKGVKDDPEKKGGPRADPSSSHSQ